MFGYRMLFCGLALCLQIGKVDNYRNSTENLLRHMAKTAKYSDERTYESRMGRDFKTIPKIYTFSKLYRRRRWQAFPYHKA